MISASLKYGLPLLSAIAEGPNKSKWAAGEQDCCDRDGAHECLLEQNCVAQTFGSGQPRWGSNAQCEQFNEADTDHQHRECYGIVVEPMPPLYLHDLPPLLPFVSRAGRGNGSNGAECSNRCRVIRYQARQAGATIAGTLQCCRSNLPRAQLFHGCQLALQNSPTEFCRSPV